MAYARLARGQTLAYRNSPFIDAAIAIGSTNTGIIFRHIIPNVSSPLVILGTLEVATLILSEAGLSFLGFGIQLPPEPSWGLMIAGGRQYIASAWWIVAFPGLTIFLTTLSLNLLAASLRAISDPVQRERLLRKDPPPVTAAADRDRSWSFTSSIIIQSSPPSPASAPPA